MVRQSLFVLLGILVIAGTALADAPTVQTRTLQIPHYRQLEPTLEVQAGQAHKSHVTWEMSRLSIQPDEYGEPMILTDGPRPIERDGALPVHGGLLHLPWGQTATAAVSSGTYYRMADNGELFPTELDGSGLAPEDFVSLGSSGIFRDITVAAFNIHPVLEGADGYTYVASNLAVDVLPGEMMEDVPERDPNRPVSEAFLPLYESMLLNGIDDLGLRKAETRGSYLVFTPEANLLTLQSSGWVQWKKQKGYNMVFETWNQDEEGIQYAHVLNTIADAYETLDPPLEYVLLVGDVNANDPNLNIPAVTIDNPNYDEFDATDWPLTHIVGNDYYPEVFLGRMTAQGNIATYQIAGRTVTYEKNRSGIPLDHPYWSSASLVAANYSTGGGTPLTPVAITQWIEERMNGIWGLDTVTPLYWTQGGEQVTAAEISTAINEGTLWVTYRGWGNAQGWEEPDYDINNVLALNNVNQLPILTTFVCNTGDFANPVNDGQGFAEVWITAGTIAEPKGAVAAIGPTDLQTNTRYNNSLIAGYFQGVYGEGIRNISAALQRAKQELYNGFVLEREPGQEVEFYWHVYHVLGDPELTMWTNTPLEMTVDAPANFTLGQGHASVTVNGPYGPLKRAYVTALQDGELVGGGFTDEAGIVSFTVDGLIEGDMILTVTKADYLPWETTVSVSQAANFVGLADWSVDAGADGYVTHGEAVDIAVTLANTGSNGANNVTATLSYAGDDGVVDILNGQSSFGSIGSGGQANNNGSPFRFELIDHVYDQHLLEFNLDIDSDAGSYTGKLWALVGNERLRYASSYENVGDTDFAPGETATLNIKFNNLGSVGVSGLNATLTSYDEAVTNISGNDDNVDIPAGGEAWIGPFDITITPDTYRGRQVVLRMSFLDDDGESYGTTYFSIPLEGATSTDPFGPDAYGYFAYDNTDNHPEAPQYEWFNLDEDPTADYHFELADDQNAIIELPIDVRYYGELYPAGTAITISANGWVSLYEEAQHTQNYFRNWQLPSTIGPWVLIAGFWDDLGPQLDQQRLNVYAKHDDANGRLIIEWSDTINRSSQQTSYPAYFAMVLYDPDAMLTETGDSVIELYYEEVANVDEGNNFATVGLEKPDKTTGLQYTYASIYPPAAAPLEAGRAIRFTTNTPDGLSEIGDPDEAAANLPGDFVLHPVQPNPFNSSTVIRFDLPEASDVRLSIYNLLGQEIANLVNRPMQAGHKEVVWQVNDRSLSSGMLLIRLEADGQEMWGKMMYVK